MDWLLGRRSQASRPQEPPPPPEPSQLITEVPDIDTLLQPHDPALLHPLANLDKHTLDYIILEDEQIKSSGALPSRGWTDDLCYGTGATYLTGTLSSAHFSLLMLSSRANLVALGIGGTWGLVEALQKPRQAVQVLNPPSLSSTAQAASGFTAAAAASSSTAGARQSGKLILNNILNHITRRGPFLGNSAGVLAMTYNLLNAYHPHPTPFFSMSLTIIEIDSRVKFGRLMAGGLRRGLQSRIL